ncbi:hypothetical protein CFP56_033481 [Quercus suber]|uniref:Uncharacterized protein n=1 Tax=Quercus suber TaxID=58331 RepID=A0AAW0LRU3_QUESU
MPLVTELEGSLIVLIFKIDAISTALLLGLYSNEKIEVFNKVMVSYAMADATKDRIVCKATGRAGYIKLFKFAVISLATGGGNSTSAKSERTSGQD